MIENHIWVIMLFLSLNVCCRQVVGETTYPNEKLKFSIALTRVGYSTGPKSYRFCRRRISVQIFRGGGLIFLTRLKLKSFQLLLMLPSTYPHIPHRFLVNSSTSSLASQQFYTLFIVFSTGYFHRAGLPSTTLHSTVKPCPILHVKSSAIPPYSRTTQNPNN